MLKGRGQKHKLPQVADNEPIVVELSTWPFRAFSSSCGNRILQWTFCLAVAFLLVSPAAWSQADRGSIAGTVTDSSGGVLPGTTVILKNVSTGVRETTITNAAGDYIFQALNPGSYTITVDRTGFKRAQRTDVVVDVNATNSQNISLEVGSAAETVQVHEGIQKLNPTSASLGLVVEQRSIQELPLIYGNPFTLETLAPGILPSGVNPNIHSYDSSTASVSVNGSTLNSIEYRLDGAPDNRIRLSAYTPSTEMINQYRVETASYDATEGHSSGGFVNVSLKSGTNNFHGGAFVYYQNRGLNANTWTTGPSSSAAKPTWLREGGDIGGPIWKDKAFFFFGYEHSKAGNPNVQRLTVPTLAERGGDFSSFYALDTDGNPPGTSNSWQMYDPFSGHPCSTGSKTVCRDPYPSNQIANIDPIAQKALTYYPKPNAPADADGSSNYSYAASEPDAYYALAGRVDYDPTIKQKLFGHIVWSNRLQSHKNGYFFPVSGTTLDYKNRGVALGYTYTLSPSTLLDMHLTWTRFINQNVVSSQGLLNATSIGMPSYLVDGLPSAADSFPRIDMTGYQSLNSDKGVLSHDDVTLGSVQISHQLGNHFLRAGVEFRMYNTNAGVTTQSNGRYTSTGTYVSASSSKSTKSIGRSLAEFESGITDTSKITINSDMAVRDDYWAGWIQDDWKATNKLVVNVGMRYEYEGPLSERNGKANTFFDAGATNPIAAAAQANYAANYDSASSANPVLPAPSAFSVNGGLRFADQNGSGNQLYHSQGLNFLPRIGFSYRVGQNTVIHAGYGIFYDSLTSFYMSGGNAGSTTTFLVSQQGFSADTSQKATSDNGLTYPSTLANPFPNGFTQVTGSSLGLETYLGQDITFQPANPKNSYNERWSLDVQHQFGAWLAMVGYVGNHGVHLPTDKQFDAIPQQYLSRDTTNYDTAIYQTLSPTVTNPFYKVIPSTATLGSSKTTSVSQLLLPYPEFTSVSAWVGNGTSNYNSLQAMLVRRFTDGASFTSAFTWSKTMDATEYLNDSDAKPWYGISDNDRTFRLALSAIYQLPFGRNRRFLNQDNRIISAIVSGWQAQGVYQIQSGQPLSFGPQSTSPVYTAGNPADSAWSRSAYKKTIVPGKAGDWFNTANWVTDTTVLPNQYQIRTFPIRFDGLRADNLNQFDAGLQRNFTAWRETQVQFRAEAINLLNHPVYKAPNTDWTNDSFGEITSQANQPRVYQFSAFYRF